MLCCIPDTLNTSTIYHKNNNKNGKGSSGERSGQAEKRNQKEPRSFVFIYLLPTINTKFIMCKHADRD